MQVVQLNPGRFGPGSFRPGSFRSNFEVGRFGLGRWVDSALGRFGPSIPKCRLLRTGRQTKRQRMIKKSREGVRSGWM